MGSSPAPEPARPPRWEVLKEGGFSSKFKEAFNALLSEVIPCGGGRRAVLWHCRKASTGSPAQGVLDCLPLQRLSLWLSIFAYYPVTPAKQTPVVFF